MSSGNNYPWVQRLIIVLSCLILSGICNLQTLHAASINNLNPKLRLLSLIPKPTSVKPTPSVFKLTKGMKIYVNNNSDDITAIGEFLAAKLNPATGYEIPVQTTSNPPLNGSIYLAIVNEDPSLGEEGYDLSINKNNIILTAFRPAGLFRGIQTIRQLLPPRIECATVQRISWDIQTATIKDYPRFEWRGAMLDVARHFFKVSDVKRFIELMSYYKMNRLHLHLSDDQGWRIMINSWPNLAIHGGSTAVGGGSGGYYTQAEYTEIVAYAQAHYITVIPEIDMPGHTNAALSSYPELNANGVAPPLYTGIKVGFSSLTLDKAITYDFINDVIKEIAALTPGPYIHIGGDEVFSPSHSDYASFITRVQNIVQSYGKRMIGWEEIARSPLSSSSIAQHWNNAELARTAVKQGVKVIMSPAPKAYMDMMYNYSTRLGQTWAGFIDVKDAYGWDPVTRLSGIAESDVLGVEAPLWTETIQTIDDIEHMVFPRLPGYAEIGWSLKDGKSWDEYAVRLGAHGPRWKALDINYYPSPQVRWK